MAITQLAPAPRPIGIFPRFIAQSSETLVLKEKIFSLSGDSFDIKSAGSNNTAFKVKGEALSLSGRKHLLDANGDSVFDIRKEHFTLHKTFYGQDESGNHLFEVRKKLQRQEEELIMEGDFFDSRAEISTKEGQVVALIDRKYFNAREFIGGQQTYGVTVAPNVDMAVITAMCICLDELRNEPA
ncbi:hypothetical protein DBV05_g7685 [Lasiodiplodia theobromae]|uniref:Protein LURP-one-related 15 n=1 Tax=Lasiodiplodia theobromae TaxID=45133 RepID=A0A5N5D770_9PEZI|nr:hypothetical protein DBV05_g7685 [Lasiodiplodia theobromae]